ncbi:MAG: MBL fold metallo-hydrolase [Candidatus Melainabacteria bacterium HGW-Melainabacteria-1]|nr:MAG: MBL fold metallo-hydrolase [Candidatus Melainabacteria bacterium HGW-Melainabacteria-1]
MKVKFWGVRGSVPTPWKEAMQVGGNTSCVQIIPRSQELIILDAGTGLRLLGDQLQQSGGKAIRGHILLSHTHWDHIQGFPFFMPAYLPGNHFTIYGANWAQKNLKNILSGQMRAPYFPVELSQMGAQLDFTELAEETFTIQDLSITTRSFNHPGGVYGFRIEQEGQVLVFATDMEYTEDNLDPRLIDFAKGADMLIFDAQYTPEEHRVKMGWGHSTHIAAAHLARLAGVRSLMLYHHDPSHSDQTLLQMEAEARQLFAASQLATEGLEIDLSSLP